MLFFRLPGASPPPDSPLPSPLAPPPQGQLELAVAAEDFTEAASLKRTIEAMRRTDPVTTVERGYRAAIATEDFAAAAKYRDAGAGLVGWWSGRGDTEDEPGGMYGVMMQITAQHGRYVGTSYSARDLALLQDAARRRRSGGRPGGSTSRVVVDAADSDEDEASAAAGGAGEGQDETGHRVFELWIEEGPDGEMRQRAVRLDSVPAGSSGSEDQGAGFATTLGGFPLSGPIGVGGVEAGAAAEGAGPLPPPRGFGADANAIGNGIANGNATSGFESWTVVDGKVSAPDAKEGNSPFPFDVDGLSMEELMSYEAQGFMTDFMRMPSFGENWERLKATYLSEIETEAGSSSSSSSSSSDSDVFEAFGGLYRRETDTSSEPHDDFFFEQYVINETEDDAGAIDIDDELDLDDGAVLELEPMDDDDYDDDEDALDAAAMALLSGRRLDRLPKGLPAAMVAEIQRAAEERGMSGLGALGGFGGEGDDDADADAWAVDEVRVPVEMELDGRHAFRLVSDVDESELASAFGESPLERTLREAAATEAEVEAAVLQGMAEAKARVAEELRAAANAAAVERGETEIVMVNLADERVRQGAEEGADEGAEEDADRRLKFAPEAFPVETYHCDAVLHADAGELDPSMALGFYCRTREDFDGLCLELELLAGKAGSTPLLTVSAGKGRAANFYGGGGGRGGANGNGVVPSRSSPPPPPPPPREGEDQSEEDDWEML